MGESQSGPTVIRMPGEAADRERPLSVPLAVCVRGVSSRRPTVDSVSLDPRRAGPTLSDPRLGLTRRDRRRRGRLAAAVAWSWSFQPQQDLRQGLRPRHVRPVARIDLEEPPDRIDPDAVRTLPEHVWRAFFVQGTWLRGNRGCAPPSRNFWLKHRAGMGRRRGGFQARSAAVVSGAGGLGASHQRSNPSRTGPVRSSSDCPSAGTNASRYTRCRAFCGTRSATPVTTMPPSLWPTGLKSARCFYAMIASTSWICVFRSTIGWARCARSPRPVLGSCVRLA